LKKINLLQRDAVDIKKENTYACYAFKGSLPEFKLIKKEVNVNMDQDHYLKHVSLLLQKKFISRFFKNSFLKSLLGKLL